MIQEPKRWIENAVDKAFQFQSKLVPDILAIESQVGPGTKHLLNNLIFPGASYLEIGMRRGASFVSALYDNDFEKAFGIENFTECAGYGFEKAIVSNVGKFLNPKSDGKWVVFFEDAWAFNTGKIPHGSITVYFYDGPHDEDSHRKAFSVFAPCLADEIILLVDDWNWDQVRAGTFRGLLESGFQTLFSMELIKEMTTHWYNGVFVAHAVRKKT